MATTINTYSVGLTLDAADYINKAALSGQETRRLSRAIEDARTPAEKYSRSQNRLNVALEKGAIDIGIHNRLMESAKDKYKKMAEAAENAANKTNKTNSAFNSSIVALKGLAAAYLGVSTVTKSIKLAAEAEQAAVAFEVLTGSINNSQVLLREIREFSDASPLTFGGVQDAAKLMLAFNVPVQEVMTNLKMLGDISLGNQGRFDMLTLAFSQMSAAGRLMGQDLLQMINAGFNPLQEISKKTGENLIELRKRMEEGKISSQEITEAFASATSEGGKFNGMTSRLADTMGGRLAIAMADLEKAGIRLGESLSPVVTGLTEGFEEGTSAVQAMLGMVEAMVDGLSFIVAVTKDLAANSAAILSGGDRGEDRFDYVNKHLDAMDKRDRERAQALETEALIRMRGGKQELDLAAAKGAALDKHASVGEQMTDDYEKALGAIKQQILEIEKGVDFARQTELAAAGYSDVQAKQIMNQEKYLDKLKEQQELEKKLAKDKESAEKNRVKELEKLKKAAEDAFTKDVENSLKAAHEYFAKQVARDNKMRDQISQGIGGDFELGSSDSRKFFADQKNAAIGAAAIPERPTPGDAHIVAEARKIFLEEQKIKAEQHRQQLAAATAIATAVKENKFQRLR